MEPNRIRRSNVWSVLRYIILFAAVGAGVLAVILFGFPLIEDLVKGVDPTLRYQPKVEADFNLQDEQLQQSTAVPEEMYLRDYAGFKVRLKNEPYIDGNSIIFTTQSGQATAGELDKVMIYNTETEEVKELAGTQKKYDRFLSPMLSGNIAVWIDALDTGGGRVVGYNMETGEQFLIKEYAYAQPQLSLSGEFLAFMQWAGDTTQRLYVYNIKTREASTVKLYETNIGNSAVSISANDMVWAEYGDDGTGTLKRIAFGADGTSKYENYDFGTAVYNPKTNGKDIVFATSKDIINGSLMLSVGGGTPVKIAENVLNYGIGSNFVVYTKDQKINVCYTDAQRTQVLTADISKNMLGSVNNNAVCYYDVTDNQVADEVVWYVYLD